MTITEDAIIEKLKNVIDPELFVNIVDLGLIYEVKIGADAAPPAGEAGDATPTETPAASETAAGEAPAAAATNPPAGEASEEVSGEPIFIEMTMTSPACPAGPQLIGGAKKEVSSIDGVGSVEVKIVLDPPWTPDRMTEDAKDQLGIF